MSEEKEEKRLSKEELMVKAITKRVEQIGFLLLGFATLGIMITFLLLSESATKRPIGFIVFIAMMVFFYTLSGRACDKYDEAIKKLGKIDPVKVSEEYTDTNKVNRKEPFKF